MTGPLDRRRLFQFAGLGTAGLLLSPGARAVAERYAPPSPMDTGHVEGGKVRFPRDQFALEVDHFADSVLTGRKPYTPGEEGVQDHVLMEAIYASSRRGRPVRLEPVSGGLDRFRSAMAIEMA